MNKYNIQHFLSKLSLVDEKYRLKDSEKEQFNIFAALHKTRAEVELHSRFISVLLSPLSSHKRKDLFLSLFLKRVGLDNFDTTSVEVYPTEAAKSEWHEIDIFILNRRTREAVIIENKIDAGDSNHEDRGQLEGYFDKVHSTYGIPKEKLYVFYLTPDRREPSRESLGKYETLEGLNGQLIDYEHEIQDWLDLCLATCIETPYLRESIIQYKNLLKKMTNTDTNIEERLAIKELIGSTSENMISAKLLIDNFIHIQWHTIADFWKELVITIKDRKYEIVKEPAYEDFDETVHRVNYNADRNSYGVKFKTKKGAEVFIWNNNKNGYIYWGFTKQWQDEEVNNVLEKFHVSNPYELEFVHDANPYYWKYFNVAENESISFPNFSWIGTYNLIDPIYRKNMIEKVMVPQIIDFLEEIGLD